MPASAPSIRGTVAALLATPSPERLRDLRASLLQADVPETARVWTVLDEFHRYLDALRTGTTSREYSNLASKLDIGAVGGVVVEHALDSEDLDDLARRLLAGLVSEGLMVLATRQHVKAWEGELSAVHRSAAWYLYGELWRWTESRRPELSSKDRRELLDRLFAPVYGEGDDGLARAALLAHVFQIVLVGRLADALRPNER